MEALPLISWGSSGMKGMIEQAKEELQILEAQQPNRFNYLKLELKSLISLLESQKLLLSNDNRSNSTSFSISSSPTTQESSTGKKRKKGSSGNEQVTEAPQQKLQRLACDGYVKRKDRIDEVFERARTCLHKIQQFKTSFSS